jgi:hypothetical protein
MRLLGTFLVLLDLAAAAADADDDLRMNQIQVIGTHNSYHVAPEESFRLNVAKYWPEAHEWDYTHKPLDQQLENGVRSFELDLFNFADGYQVFHAPRIDKESNCPRFTDCLNAVKAWSDAHPNHVPISFLLEIKDQTRFLIHPPLPPLVPGELDRLEAEIEAVFAEDDLVTPDLVRGEADNLEAAILKDGWPRLNDVRGRIMFVLHEGGEMRDWYTEGRPNLEGRRMFVRSSPGRPDAAVLIMDGPDVEAIQERVQQGYYVRTRADAGLRQAKAGDTTRRDEAFESGAHIVSTDFPNGEMHPDTKYVVRFEDNAPARCNPVNAPATCSAASLKAPAP